MKSIRFVLVLMVLIFLAAPAFSMDRYQAVEYFMDKGASGADAVDLAFALYFATEQQDNSHFYSVAVLEANRRINHFGAFGITFPQAIASVRDIVLEARKILAREAARFAGEHVYD